MYIYICVCVILYNATPIHTYAQRSRLPGCDEPGPRYGLALSSEQVSDFELKGLWKDSRVASETFQ